MLALALFERSLCACGFHPSQTNDRENFFFTFQDQVCNVCAASAKYGRVQADADDKAVKALGESPSPYVARPGDGRRTFVKPLSRSEVQERRSRNAAMRSTTASPSSVTPSRGRARKR